MAIKMSPDELMGYATKLAKYAQEASTLAKNIDSSIKAAASNWEGAAQKRYVEDFERIRPTLDKEVPELLNTMSANLKKMAQTMADTDRQLAGG